MKLFMAIAILSCVFFSASTYAERTKSVPIEDQGPGKGGKDGKNSKEGKDTKKGKSII